MRGEDKIFLMEVVMATIYKGEPLARFVSNKQKVDRLLALRNELGQDSFDVEVTNLKKEMAYE